MLLIGPQAPDHQEGFNWYEGMGFGIKVCLRDDENSQKFHEFRRPNFRLGHVLDPIQFSLDFLLCRFHVKTTTSKRPSGLHKIKFIGWIKST